MLNNPIIKNMYFTLLKHVIISTVAFVMNSEYKKKIKIKIMYIYYTKNLLSNTSTLNLQNCIIKCSLKIKKNKNHILCDFISKSLHVHIMQRFQDFFYS